MKQNPALDGLKDLGWEFHRMGKGRHQIWKHPKFPASSIAVPVGGTVPGRIVKWILLCAKKQMTPQS